MKRDNKAATALEDEGLGNIYVSGLTFFNRMKAILFPEGRECEPEIVEIFNRLDDAAHALLEEGKIQFPFRVTESSYRGAFTRHARDGNIIECQFSLEALSQILLAASLLDEGQDELSSKFSIEMMDVFEQVAVEMRRETLEDYSRRNAVSSPELSYPDHWAPRF